MARLEFLNYLIVVLSLLHNSKYPRITKWILAVVYFIWAFHSYLIFMFFDESEKHYFWFVLNACWLKDNYDSTDMFIDDFIKACLP